MRLSHRGKSLRRDNGWTVDNAVVERAPRNSPSYRNVHKAKSFSLNMLAHQFRLSRHAAGRIKELLTADCMKYAELVA